jgi:3-oxoacyl-[acyl-carrier protein] reductase
MDLGLAGKACLVAGASRGIGRAIALQLGREGARIAAIARGGEGLAAVARELDAAGGGPHVTVTADVTTAAGAAAAVDGAVRALGGLDVVIANVGKSFVRSWAPTADGAAAMTDEDLGQSLDMNVWSAARIASRALPHLVATRGSLTFISSVWGREAGGAPGYNVAKAGVIAMAKALARDYAPHGVRVNSVAPGSILFPGGGWERRQQADPAGIADMIRRELPFGRFGTPEEVANVVAFLSSPRASWIAGACVVVDGAQSRAL